ncbi:MAG: hypothetical protein JWR61_4020 [Ferruginibacter sp.]|nr:hypothetical protein [Ferruginibacter sp.]
MGYHVPIRGRDVRNNAGSTIQAGHSVLCLDVTKLQMGCTARKYFIVPSCCAIS